MNQARRGVRLPLMVTRSEAEAIDVRRLANRMPPRAEAIRRLIELGSTHVIGAGSVHPVRK
jgi:hypothetical protein